MSLGAYARRISLIREMFLDTADMNYVGARAAFFERRDLDFWWLSLHAIEKYMKAALLMNGEPATKANHDLTMLLRKLQKVDPRMSPPPFVRPKLAGPVGWFEMPHDRFLSNLNVYGSATNRYAAYSYIISDVDLFRADHLVYWARRYARPFHQKLADGREIDWVDELTKSPRLWRHHSGAPLERLADLPSRDPAKRAFVRANVSFFPEKRHRPPVRRGSQAHNAPIFRCINTLRGSRPGSAARAETREVLRWVLDHIYLPKGEVIEINSLLAAHP